MITKTQLPLTFTLPPSSLLCCCNFLVPIHFHYYHFCLLSFLLIIFFVICQLIFFYFFKIIGWIFVVWHVFIQRFLCLLRCVLLIRNSKSIKAAPVLVFCLEWREEKRREEKSECFCFLLDAERWIWFKERSDGRFWLMNSKQVCFESVQSSNWVV